jgi:hypothetical protein
MQSHGIISPSCKISKSPGSNSFEFMSITFTNDLSITDFLLDESRYSEAVFLTLTSYI